MGYFLSVLFIAVTSLPAQAASKNFVLQSNAWAKQDRCLTDLLNSLPVSNGRVKAVTFPSVKRNPYYKPNIGETASMQAKMGLGKRSLTIKLKAATGSSFYGTREGSKYYSFEYFRSIVFNPDNGSYTPGESECIADVFEGFDVYPVAQVDVCRCLPMP